MSALNLFAEEEHQPFLWESGSRAALLVHGFPGTPAEMRSIGRILHEAGWTVQGILLPGFGPEIETLPEREYKEWLKAAREALVALQQDYDPVMLVGYSMGVWWQRAIWHVMKHFLRFTRPLRRANFAGSRLRQGLNVILPGIDLDDEAIQQKLRELPVPVQVFNQLLAIGYMAKRAAKQATMPTLVVQGSEDLTIRPSDTCRLLKQLPNVVNYVEVEAGHALTYEEGDHWPQLVEALLTFVADS